MIVKSKKESGRLRELLEVTDCRRYTLGHYKTRYFDAAFDFHWTRASKIIKPGHPPEQDSLSLGVIAAEELTEAEFKERLENKAVQQIINQAKDIINPHQD
jgi:hypothetical protein